MQRAEGLEYESTGDGDAALLIHGALIADALLPLAREAALADAYRLIRYRRRGHGGSDPVPAGFTLEQQAADALALLGHLGIERAHVIGHSGGGAIATQLALAAPDVVRTLVVLEPAIFPAEMVAPFVEGAAPVLAAYRAGDAGRAVDLWMEMVAVGADWRGEVAASVPGGPEQADRDAASFFDVDFSAFMEWSLDAERARQIRAPVLYVNGSESGPLIDIARRHFQSLVPGAEHAVVPGVNHSMQMQDAKRVAEPIAAFLSRH